MTATVSRLHVSVHRVDERAGSRGRERVSGALDVRELLANHTVAVGLGVLTGLVLLSPLVAGIRFITPEKIDRGLALVMGSVFGGMLLALGALFGYRALSPDAVVLYGAALVGGFVIGLGAFALYVGKTILWTDDKTRR